MVKHSCWPLVEQTSGGLRAGPSTSNGSFCSGNNTSDLTHFRAMIEANISDKLTEQRERLKVSLSLKQAREAVEAIALALTMVGAESVALFGTNVTRHTYGRSTYVRC